jgi:hypothetical protein
LFCDHHEEHLSPCSFSENYLACFQVAQRLIGDWKLLPERHLKYTFPYLQYMTLAVNISMELMSQNPRMRDLHGNSTVQVLISLKEYLFRSWMSDRMSRKILQTTWFVLDVYSSSTTGGTGLILSPGVLSDGSHTESRGVDAAIASLGTLEFYPVDEPTPADEDHPTLGGPSAGKVKPTSFTGRLAASEMALSKFPSLDPVHRLGLWDPPELGIADFGIVNGTLDT